MKRRKFPFCCKCGNEINPVKYDDCEKYYPTDEGIMCMNCYQEYSIDWIKSNLDEFAELVGVPVIEVKEDE